MHPVTFTFTCDRRAYELTVGGIPPDDDWEIDGDPACQACRRQLGESGTLAPKEHVLICDCGVRYPLTPWTDQRWQLFIGKDWPYVMHGERIVVQADDIRDAKRIVHLPAALRTLRAFLDACDHGEQPPMAMRNLARQVLRDTRA